MTSTIGHSFGYTQNCYRSHQNCLNLGLIPVYTMGYPERYELPSFYVRDSKGYIDRVRVRYHEKHKDHWYSLPPGTRINIDTCEIETGGSWHSGITYGRAVVISLEDQE